MNLLESILEGVITMDKGKVLDLSRKALDEGIKPEELLDQALTPGMHIVGEEYANGNIFIPEMLLSADAVKAAMELLKPLFTKSELPSLGKIVIGTVEGDIHNIGQEIVSMFLEVAGFEVCRLGVDVPAEKFAESVKQENADIVGMSAFLSTTSVHFQKVIDALKEAGLRERAKVMIGGAIASDELAEAIGADGYGANANAAVRLAKSFVGK